MSGVWLHGAGGLETAAREFMGKPIVAGRSGDLRLDDLIEKKHARFVLRDGRVRVAPLGNGRVWLNEQMISGETEVGPGELVLLDSFAAVFVAHSPDQAPAPRARAAIERLASFQRDRVLVRLLEIPVPGLFALALAAVRKLPDARLHDVSSILVPVMDRVLTRPGAPPAEAFGSLRATLASARPAASSALLVYEQERDRRLAARAAAPPPAPLDEDADPEARSPRPPSRAWHVLPSDRDVGHGFASGAPPIEPARWPRSPRDGAPMLHLATLLVPADYRVRGERLVAVAIFQADDHTRPAAPDPPRHEGDALVLEDGIGGSYGLIWLDADTFARGPGRAAPDGVDVRPPQFQRLRARLGDPNVGQTLPGWGDDPGGYVGAETGAGVARGLDRFSFQTSRAMAHFGGTSVACDDYAGGLGPFYVGLEHGFGGANFGGGNAVLDLDRERIAFGS